MLTAETTTLIVSTILFAGCTVAIFPLINRLMETFTGIKSRTDKGPMEREFVIRQTRAIGATLEFLAHPFESLQPRVARMLIYAGRPYGGISARHYIAFALASAIAIGFICAFVVGVSMAVLGRDTGGVLGYMAFVGIAGSLIGVLLQSMELSRLEAENTESITHDFPFFLDLAILIVQANGTPIEALDKYVEVNPDSPLARELAVTAREADATSFDNALIRMSKRVKNDAISGILRNLAQSERSAGDLEEFYAAQAVELRYLRQDLATQAAEKLRLSMKLPEMMIVFAIFLAVLAPAIVQMRAGWL